MTTMMMKMAVTGVVSMTMMLGLEVVVVMMIISLMLIMLIIIMIIVCSLYCSN